MRRYWFRAKKYGWGWGLPLTLQGWGVLVLYCYLLFILLAQLTNTSSPAQVFDIVLQSILLTIVLIVICYITGEKPRWRWGEQEGKKGGDKKDA